MDLKTFFDNFEIMAEAPNGVQKLREMILQLAVQGKLVPQDPNDEPASVLLEKIQTEKRRFSKEGKTKRFKVTPTVSADQFPWRLPENWEWTRLATIGSVNPRNEVGNDLKVSFFPMRLIPAKLGESVQFEERIWSEVKQGFTHLAEGDVVCAKITPCFQNGKSAVLRNLVNGIGAGTTELHVFRAVSDEIMADYVLLFLKSASFLNNGVEVMTGSAGQKRVPADYFAMRPFPLPPANEQKRIVAKVDELMALCDDLEARKQKTRQTCIQLNDACIDKMLAAPEPARFNKHWQRIHTNFDLLYSQPENVTKLRQAILQLAVQGKLVPQDPNDEPASVLLEKVCARRRSLVEAGTIRKGQKLTDLRAEKQHFEAPCGWEWVLIDDIYEVVGGIQKTPKRKPVKNYFPYLRVGNVYRGYLNLGQIENFELGDGELERWRLKDGDLLVVEGNGSENEIGRCAIWHEEIENCVHQNHLIRCRPIGHTVSDYTLLFLNSPAGISIMKELSITTSGLYNLSVGKIRKISIPIPPLNEQKRIVANVDQLMALCDDLESKLQKSQKRNDRLMEAAVAEMLAA